jgi:site-specific DNA-cytosine methylase
MSPPCQPYTRQHPPTENDLRNNALLNLISTLKKLKKPPTYVALENVIGFEESPSCSSLIDTLELVGIYVYICVKVWIYVWIYMYIYINMYMWV